MNRLTAALGAAPLLLASVLAQAQTPVPSPKLTIKIVEGTSETQIPLEPTSTVQIDAAGDLTVKCKLDANSRCPGLGVGGGETGDPPSAATLTASVTTLEAGQPLGLTWTSTGADVCRSSGPSNATGWTGVNRDTSGSISLSSLAQGTYTFQLRCYSAGGSRTADSALVTVTEPTTPPATDYCAEYYDGTPAMPTGAQFNAHGFTKFEKSYFEVFGIQPGQSYSHIMSLPGVHLNPTQTRYLAIPFVMTDDAGGDASQMNLQWVDGNPNFGAPGGAIVMTVSPCPGDFRQPVSGSQDIYLDYQCRNSQPQSLNSNGITITSAPSLSGCMAPKDKKMYINVATYNMYSPTTPTNTQCGPGVTVCGAGVTVR